MPRLLAPAASLVLFVTPALAQTPAGGEFQVNTYTTGSQAVASIAAHDRHGFVIVWVGFGPDGIRGFRGRRFDLAGAPLGPEFLVGVGSGGRQSVAFSRDGEFMVVWEGEQSPLDISGRRFDRTGAALGAPFTVNNDTIFTEIQPVVAALNPGFVVVWTSFQDAGAGGATQLRGQLFDASGARMGTQFRLDSVLTSVSGVPASSRTRPGASSRRGTASPWGPTASTSARAASTGTA